MQQRSHILLSTLYIRPIETRKHTLDILCGWRSFVICKNREGCEELISLLSRWMSQCVQYSFGKWFIHHLFLFLHFVVSSCLMSAPSTYANKPSPVVCSRSHQISSGQAGLYLSMVNRTTAVGELKPLEWPIVKSILLTINSDAFPISTQFLFKIPPNHKRQVHRFLYRYSIDRIFSN